MTCDRVQAALSRALDGGREPTELADHLAGCPECAEFAEVSADVAARYRTRVRAGVDRLRRATPSKAARRVPVRRLLPVAAALLLVFLSVPLLRRPWAPPAPAAPAVSALRVPLYDGPAPEPVDLQVLAWMPEPPLPRRLDQELPGSPGLDVDVSVALPPGLRF